MKKTLIITEKPSVSMDIARALGKFENKKDYLESDKYVITWALGHLVTLFDPEDYDKKLKFWALSTLPIIPKKFQFKPIEKTKKRFNVVKKLIKRKDIDTIVNACDAGREGELIFRNIIQLVPAHNKKIKRLWLSAMTKKEIIKGFNELHNSTDFDLLGKAALARMESDWLVGINATRAFTRRWGTLLSIGRVQTPTLNIICKREQEIKAFKKEKYFELEGVFQGTAVSYKGTYIDKKNNSRIKMKKKALALIEKLQGKEGKITNVKISRRKKPHPLLYDLTELQREANIHFGYSAQRTLNIAQRLYESRKLITYPRTDSRYLPKAMVPELKKILRGMNISIYEKFIDEILSKEIKLDGRVINDKGVSDHFAIIPTGEKPVFSQLARDEQNVFDLISRRFLSVFFDDAIIEKLSFKTIVSDEAFKTELERIKKFGWMVVYNAKEKEALIDVKDGTNVLLNKINLLEKETTPPPRFTDATILTAMETAGKLVEEEELREAMKERGLGTPATRAGIIERLIEVEYLERSGKSLIPLDKGMRLIDLISHVGADEVLSPVLTGEWEKRLRDIEKGKLEPDRFLEGIKHLTETIVEKVKNFKGDEGILDNKPVGKCPKCGADVVETAKAFVCVNRKENKCDFIIWKKIINKTITREMAEKLLKGEKVHLTGLISKNRRRFDADIKLINNKVSFVFPEREKDVLINPGPVGKCPKCGADVVEGKNTFFCSNRDNGCTFHINKLMGGKEITRDIAKELLENKRTKLITDFKSKRGKPFSAYLYIDKSGIVKFEFKNKLKERKK